MSDEIVLLDNARVERDPLGGHATSYWSLRCIRATQLLSIVLIPTPSRSRDLGSVRESVSACFLVRVYRSTGGLSGGCLPPVVHGLPAVPSSRYLAGGRITPCPAWHWSPTVPCQAATTEGTC